MGTPAKHYKPSKRSLRQSEKSIEAAKKAKLKEAALLEKYAKQATRLSEKAQKEQTKAVAVEQEDEELAPRKKKSDLFFTIAGIFFLLIAVLVTLWQFGFLDKFLQKPVPKPDELSATSSVATTATVTTTETQI